MKKSKDLLEIFIMGGILLALVLFLFITAYKIKVEDKNNNKENDVVETPNNMEKDDVIEEDKDDDTNTNVENLNPNQDDNKVNEEENNIKPPIVDKEDNSDKLSYEEQEVIEYVSLFSNDIDNHQSNDKTFTEKSKETFITIVDFLFYDGKIKGHTFDELSFKAKVKVLKLVADIDYKLDKKFPGYKDTIKEKTSNLKSKIAYLYLETTNKFCDKVSNEVCETARDDFNNMKDKYGYTWDIVKDAILKAGGKLTSMLSEWYKSIK